MDVLLSFAAALVSLRLAGRLLRGAALRLGRRAAQLRGGRGGDGVGLGARLGRAVVPRLLPRRRAPLGAAPRHRLAAARRPALGRPARPALRRARGRRRGRDAGARRVLVDGRPARPGPRRRASRASSRSPAARSARSRSWSSRQRRSGGGRSATRCSSRRSRPPPVASALTQTAVAAAAAGFAAGRRAALRVGPALGVGASTAYQATTRSANPSSALLVLARGERLRAHLHRGSARSPPAPLPRLSIRPTRSRYASYASACRRIVVDVERVPVLDREDAQLSQPALGPPAPPAEERHQLSVTQTAPSPAAMPRGRRPTGTISRDTIRRGVDPGDRAVAARRPHRARAVGDRERVPARRDRAAIPPSFGVDAQDVAVALADPHRSRRRRRRRSGWRGRCPRRGSRR